MKRLLISILLVFTLPILPACSTPPSARVIQYQTLRAVGETAKTSMQAATTLLKQGKISVIQWERVAVLYDNRFQPAYRLAVLTAQSDLALASPDVLNLAIELSNLITEYSK